MAAVPLDLDLRVVGGFASVVSFAHQVALQEFAGGVGVFEGVEAGGVEGDGGAFPGRLAVVPGEFAVAVAAAREDGEAFEDAVGADDEFVGDGSFESEVVGEAGDAAPIVEGVAAPEAGFDAEFVGECLEDGEDGVGFDVRAGDADSDAV